MDEVSRRQLSHWTGQYGVPGSAFWGTTVQGGIAPSGEGWWNNPGYADPSMSGSVQGAGIISNAQFSGDAGETAGGAGVGTASGGAPA